jgi:hypothetical protein
MADYSLGLALGYGREKAGRVGTGVGFNAYKIFSGKYIETGATVKKTGETYTFWPARSIIGHGRPSGGARGEPRRVSSRNRRSRRKNFTASNRRSSSRFIRTRSTRRRRRRCTSGA